MTGRFLFLRALFAFLMLPLMVGGLLPWLLLPIDRWRTSGTWFGLPVWGCGIFILLCCVRDFYIIGKGTLAPWDPPKSSSLPVSTASCGIRCTWECSVLY